ncbi:MAG: hypothetical protein IJU60_05385 [Acholeplasmatales bacterium]|nr:hypothetical protein [Acholeplasmatales bacterium]
MKIAICEENKDYLDKLSSYVKEFIDEKGVDAKLDIFQESDTLLNRMLIFKIESTNYDLIILGMDNKINGINFVKRIREDGYHSMIIFLSDNLDNVINSFKVEPLDFILLPTDKNTVFQSLERAYNKLNIKDNITLLIRLKDYEQVSITISDINYIENKDRRMVYHMIDGTTYTTVALRIKFLDSIPFDYTIHKFVVAGNNNLVNMKQIQSFKDNMIVLKNAEEIKVPKKNFSSVKNTYQDYLFEINNN